MIQEKDTGEVHQEVQNPITTVLIEELYEKSVRKQKKILRNVIGDKLPGEKTKAIEIIIKEMEEVYLP